MAVLALAGCGGGATGKDHADTSSSGSTSSVSSSSVTSPAPGADASTDAGSGTGSLVDAMAKTMNDGKSAHVTITVGSAGSGEGDIVFSGKDTAMQMKIKTAGQDVEMRFVDGALYVGAPGQPGKWMKMDAAQIGSTLSVDPAQTLKQIESSDGAAKSRGNGHWQISTAGVTTDVQVGTDGYLDKVNVAGGATGTISMTYSDWGERVSVEAPPTSDIIATPSS
ncbi:hypothetical protein [Nocardioides sp. Iso805N]|uniref:hypothetical protein n=1 Tax=Nocardioides sp. Iso805N TaxID=1283287 RepID=UPI0003618DD2|nr:hypothetical protein [Nocardioides sp. Iso805N]